MAANLYKAGGEIRTVTYSNSGSAISAGDVVVLASTDAKKCRIGIALDDIAATSGTGQVAISGCWTLPKVSAAVIAQGESVNWDSSEGAVDDNAHTTAAGDVKEFGMADAAGAATTTSINVWIDEPGTFDAA
jgi:predicted RecA/RadA family phage recombinase